MPNIELEEVIKAAVLHPFWGPRGKAIQSYANLEQSLVALFSLVSETSRETASIVLARIANADARNKIIERLFRRKYQTAYNLFRNSFFEQLRPIDLKRNEIVHWNVATYIPISGAYPSETGISHAFTLKLVPPIFIVRDTEPTPIDFDDLKVFIAKCEFYQRICQMFCIVMNPPGPMPATDKQTWLDIFSQPIVYPPPSTHPLFPTPGALEALSQAFVVTD